MIPSKNLPTVMGHRFDRVPSINIERSKFDRSHGYKTTFDAGFLIPVLVDEVIPGDTFNLRMTSFARLATPIKPIMDNMYLDTFFFFVPNRLLWINWEKFNGAQDDPGDPTDFEVPTVGLGGADPAIGSISDYFGLPPGGGAAWQVSALHYRAYNLIYNTWFRDQNLQDSVAEHTGDGNIAVANYWLLRRGKRHDYFTSCLPWPQKGPDVSLPLGTVAPVNLVPHTAETNAMLVRNAGTGALADNQGLWAQVTTGVFTNDAKDTGYVMDPDGRLETDLSTATSATINALREAEQLQVLYERDARGGTRYIEIIKSHFGVVSPDARLQRPEYLGGGSSPINIHPIAQTTASPDPETSTNAQGNLAGFGTASFAGHGFNKTFVEHGVIIGLANVRADLTYQTGLNRMWSRRTRFDFYWPALAHLGEQAVLNKEIYVQATAADDEPFGYQERYAEYRYKPSEISGLFRSRAGGSLDIWHLSQEFGALPTLGSAFISEEPPLDRVIAVPAEPHFLFDAYFTYMCARPMPVYGVPSLGGRL